MWTLPTTRNIVQAAWVVPDLDAAIHAWHAAMGVGPFLVNRRLTIGEPLYRGRPSTTQFSTALAQAGDTQIELVEQHDDTPSCYRDLVPAGRTAFHHVAIIAGDYDVELARYADAGFEVASSGVFGDLRFCYVDTSATLGHMVEIVEDKPSIRAFFGAVRKAAEGWDGTTDLIREMR